MTSGNALEAAKEDSMQTRRQFRAWRSFSVIASILALGIGACSEKTEPPPAPKTVAPAVQPGPPVEAKQAPAQGAVAERPKPPPVDPDAELASRVKAALGGQGGINVHRIDVTAEGGVVTLYGTADTADQRATAAMVAGKVAGVKSVLNKLAIVAGS